MNTNSYTSIKPEPDQFTKLKQLLNEIDGRPIKNKEIQELIFKSLDLLRGQEPTPENVAIKKALAKSLDSLDRLHYVSTKGFFEMYFESLPNYKTPKEAFTAVNEYYLQAFSERKYQTFKEFKKALGMN